eukprot:8715951-Lingulodinium_polyedra.AAC.1
MSLLEKVAPKLSASVNSVGGFAGLIQERSKRGWLPTTKTSDCPKQRLRVVLRGRLGRLLLQ